MTYHEKAAPSLGPRHGSENVTHTDIYRGDRSSAIDICRTCRWFRLPQRSPSKSMPPPPRNPWGECRRRPPVLIPGDDALWPSVRASDWCGAYEDRADLVVEGGR